MTSKNQEPEGLKYPNWELIVSSAVDNYFLKHEVKRLMQINDSLEWRAQLAYSFGYGDHKGGQEFDSTFLVDSLEITDSEIFYVNDINFDNIDMRNFDVDDVDTDDDLGIDS